MVSVHLKLWEELSRSSPSASQQLPLRIVLVNQLVSFSFRSQCCKMPVRVKVHQDTDKKYRCLRDSEEETCTDTHTHFYRNQFNNQIPKLIIYTPSHGVLFNLVSSLSGTGNWGVKRFVESTNFQGKSRPEEAGESRCLLSHPWTTLSCCLSCSRIFFKNRT